ncbi:single-stranded DNA-binding protein [Saimiriine alphaherpesvirus 1]|uniref:Single-stranded DNA-binding protein n=1 Tax=Saimiriine herpesvirus 1 (strain MV-5-4-PSL) TaxID=10353 RepID=E2IUE0_SHV1|nr:single-stranded DNA-binding protein [Saimiriine alphaherpesvirus 1]ADO13798.1 single-stranded DNA-binding protein [Saimiriine alphaherpesvirus 1]
METKPKTTTVQLNPGPIGYVYARTAGFDRLEELGLLSARSADSDTAVVPLVAGLTVETGFVSNVAAVVGSRTTGLGGSVTLKLMPTHYSPSAYVFHGARHLSPSSLAPNLGRLCAQARARFGFSAYEPRSADPKNETTGDALCQMLDLDPDDAILYLVVTHAFKEAVYLCNAFLHFGGTETVSIGDGSATRVPLYPLQMFTPDFTRVLTEPFNRNHRSIGEDFEYPLPFFNQDLCRLLFESVVGPAAVALRARNVDAVARAAAHLAFDENHEGAALPADMTFTAFDAGSSGGGQGGAAQSSSRGRAGDGAKATPAGGFERRLASVMSADAALAFETLLATAVFDETPTDIDAWPMLEGRDSPRERASAVGAYLGRAAGLVGAMVFSTNSALHMTEVDDAGPADPKDPSAPSFYRFYLIAAPHVAGNPQVDRDGRPVPGQEGKPTVPLNGGRGGGGGGNNAAAEFSHDHLAMACGFSPALLAKMLFYLERCDGGAIGGRTELDVIRYVSDTSQADVPCDMCAVDTRHACAHTTMLRLRQRHPRFGGSPRGAIGIFGTMNSAYSDCDVLGNYAAFSALKRPESNDSARAVMQDTYRASAERVMAELEQLQYVEPGVPASLARLESIVTSREALRTVLDNVRQIVEREVDQLMRNLVEARDYKIRDAILEANHAMSLTLDPYSCAPCPLLQLLVRRSNLAVFQDLALSQCHGVFAGQSVEGRNFRNQFQPVLRRRVMDLLNGGFLPARTLTLALGDGAISAPDLRKSQSAPPAVDFEGDLARVSFDLPREMRVKSRVLFAGASANASEAARARVASLQALYQRPEKRVDILLGPAGFLLKQFHQVLFPGGKPPGSDQPNPHWFWTSLQRNQLPARLLTRDDIDLIAYVKRFSTEYGAMNYINLAPNNVSEMAMYYMANQILRYCNHSTYFINTLTAILAGSRRPRELSAVAPWSDRGGAALETSARAIVASVDDYPGAWTSVFASCNLLRPVMASRPMVVLALSISKYYGMAGNTRVFQAGNWANLLGGKNACPLLLFDRTRRFVLACPRAGFVCSAAAFAGQARESSLCEQLRAIVAEGGPSVASSVFSAAVKALGARTAQLQVEDWLALTEDDYLSEEMMEFTRRTLLRGDGEWSAEAAAEVAREAEALVTQAAGGDEEVFNFGACDEDDEAALACFAGGEPGASGGGAALAAFASPAGSKKRAMPREDLFGEGPAEKRGALTLDML